MYNTKPHHLPRNATLTASGFWGHSIDALVIIPSVPSEPINNCLRSYPVLSFLRDDKQSNTSPFGNTCR